MDTYEEDLEERGGHHSGSDGSSDDTDSDDDGYVGTQRRPRPSPLCADGMWGGWLVLGGMVFAAMYVYNWSRPASTFAAQGLNCPTEYPMPVSRWQPKDTHLWVYCHFPELLPRFALNGQQLLALTPEHVNSMGITTSQHKRVAQGLSELRAWESAHSAVGNTTPSSPSTPSTPPTTGQSSQDSRTEQQLKEARDANNRLAEELKDLRQALNDVRKQQEQTAAKPPAQQQHPPQVPPNPPPAKTAGGAGTATGTPPAVAPSPAPAAIGKVIKLELKEGSNIDIACSAEPVRSGDKLCETLSISIVSAKYGNIWPSLPKCHFQDVSAHVKAKCHGKSHCVVPALSHIKLGVPDVCPGLGKKMKLSYTCKKVVTGTVVVHHSPASHVENVFVNGFDLMRTTMLETETVSYWREPKEMKFLGEHGRNVVAVQVSGPAESSGVIAIVKDSCGNALFRTEVGSKSVKITDKRPDGRDNLAWRYEAFDDSAWKLVPSAKSGFSEPVLTSQAKDIGAGAQWIWSPGTEKRLWMRFNFEVGSSASPGPSLEQIVELSRPYGPPIPIPAPRYVPPKSIEMGGLHYHPLSFCIPHEKVVDEVQPKERMFARLLPGIRSTYGFSNEKDYYHHYRTSRFCITHKKAGWDCERHYEILGQGCIPLFLDINHLPKYTAYPLPKDTLRAALRMSGLYYSGLDGGPTKPWYPPWNGGPPPDWIYKLPFTVPDHFSSNITELNTTLYDRVAKQLLAYTKKYLICRGVANYTLSVSGNVGAKSVLYISDGQYPDYLRDLLAIGFRRLLGDASVDYVRVCHLYQDCHKSASYGGGFTYSKLLPADHIDRDPKHIERDINEHKYDVVVYGCLYRKLHFHDAVKANYKPNEILYFNGADWGSPFREASAGSHVFIRELGPPAFLV